MCQFGPRFYGVRIDQGPNRIDQGPNWPRSESNWPRSELAKVRIVLNSNKINETWLQIAEWFEYNNVVFWYLNDVGPMSSEPLPLGTWPWLILSYVYSFSLSTNFQVTVCKNQIIYITFSCKSACCKVWPCRKIGQGQPMDKFEIICNDLGPRSRNNLDN